MTILDAPPHISALPGGPAELAALVRHAVEAGARREVLVWRPARAVAGGARAHHRRLLDEAAAPLRHAPRLRLFSLPDGGLVAAAVPPALALAAAEAALREVLDPDDTAAALRRLRLPEDAAALLGLLEDALMGGHRPAPIPPDMADAGEVTTDPAILRALDHADLSAHLARQSVCRLEPGGESRMLWTDERPDWRALMASLGAPAAARPDAALAATVAGRQAAGIAHGRTAATPLSLPMPPDAVVTEGWLRMDSALPAATRRQIVLCLDLAALLRQPDAALIAARYSALRGYPLAVDVAATEALALLAPGLWRDLPGARLRLAWSESLPGRVRSLGGLQGMGPEIWLAGADRASAIAWGWSQGIRIFQGPLVDRLR